MLTDNQIEAAARKLCELRGIDPEGSFGKRVVDWTPENGVTIEDLLQWQNLACEIRAADQVREAIASVEPMGALERIDPAQYQRIKEVVTNTPPFCPPPGPCECGHPLFKHFAVTDLSSLRCHDCECAGYFEFSAPQDRG